VDAGLQIVAPEHGLCIEVRLREHDIELIGAQLTRLQSRAERESFLARIRDSFSRVLLDVVDRELKPPSPAQIAYAVHIAKEMGLAVPPEVLRYRCSARAFLEEHVPRFQAARRRELRGPDEPG
jgi:hypothetical protein